ncbi:MAG: DNA modification methylase [Candidatus Limnocylindrales bacterium]
MSAKAAPVAPPPFRNRIVGHGDEDPTQLLANPDNWRVHPAAQRNALRGALDTVGWVAQVLVNRSTGHVVDGHARIEEAISRGEATVPVLYVDLSAEEEALVLATLDPIGAMADRDGARLEALLARVTVDDAGLRRLLADLAGPKVGLVDPDDVPEPPDTPITQPGDLWVLGDHRLLCGNAGNVADLDRLLAGETPALLNTDPPYNVKVEPRSNNAIAAGLSSFAAPTHHQALDLARHPEKSKPTGKMRAKDRPLINDFVSDAAFLEMLAAWFANAARVLRPGGGFYIWGGYANIANYPAALKAAGLYFSQALIWVKEHPVLTRKDFMGNHEWCFYGWREGAAHRFFGPANVPDVWSVKKVNPTAMVHLTEKPVELARLAIDYSSLHGEAVLDLFGGSGSTLIAAEQTGRHAYLMEIDPAYCDVIVARWHAFTGQKAERLP